MSVAICDVVTKKTGKRCKNKAYREGLKKFNKLIEGHKKLFIAIGNLRKITL